MIRQENCKVFSNKKIADSIYEMVVSGNLASEMAIPGQFVHIRAGEGIDPLLRRPISIASIDKDTQTFTIIYRKQGRGTSLLADKIPGQEVDVLGPLGNGFPVLKGKAGQTALLIGGGVGVPPLYELAKQLSQNNVRVIIVIGFQTASAVFYEKELSMFGEVFVATADGSYGEKGFVTDVIAQRKLQADIVYACGPTPMLKAVESGKYAQETFLSLEERMGCGIGACFACVCHTQDDPKGVSYKKVCTDGPVFAAGEVVL